MKRIFTILTCTFFMAFHSSAMNISFEFANATIVNDGSDDWFEIDVIVSTNTGSYKLGSGQIYLNYNPVAFGNSVFGNGSFEVVTAGYLLGQLVGSPPFQLGVYGSFVSNDNESTRVSFSWQQALSSGCFSDNIGTSSSALLRLRFKYLPGQTSTPPDVCFEQSGSFGQQTFPACGPDVSCATSLTCPDPQIPLVSDFNCFFALPVELTYFDAEPINTYDAITKWVTASEQNASHYEVERSSDGRNWDFIGKVTAHGNSNQSLQYSYLDKEVFQPKKPERQFYYRLRMVDFDGKYEYSEIKNVDFRFSIDQGIAVEIYPNPAQDFVNINFATEDLVNLKFVSVSGQALIERDIRMEDGHFELQLPNALPAGVYMLQLKTADHRTFSKRLVIQQKN